MVITVVVRTPRVLFSTFWVGNLNKISHPLTANIKYPKQRILLFILTNIL